MIEMAVRLAGAGYIVAGIAVASLGQFAVPVFTNGFGSLPVLGVRLGGVVWLAVTVVGIAISLGSVAFVVEDFI